MSKKKRNIIIAAMLVCGLLVFAVAHSPFVTHATSSIDNYVDKEKFEGSSGLLVFPDQVREEDVEDYYYSHRHIIFDPDIQLYLRCRYSKEDFRKECERLAGILVEHEGKVNAVRYNMDDYVLPAYEAINGFDHCYEYALVDESSRTIDYVFLQQINDVEDIVFSKDRLPDTYGEDQGLDGFCIYAFSLEGDDMDGRLMVYE